MTATANPPTHTDVCATCGAPATRSAPNILWVHEPTSRFRWSIPEHRVVVARTTNRRHPHDEGSILMALLMSLMVLSLLAVMTSTVAASHAKTRTTRVQTVSAQVVTAATSDAMMFGNLGKFTGSEATGTGTLSTGTYTWTAVRRPETPGLADLTITTTSNGKTRTYSGVLEAVPVLSFSRKPDDTVQYRPRADSTTSTAVVWQVKTAPAFVP